MKAVTLLPGPTAPEPPGTGVPRPVGHRHGGDLGHRRPRGTAEDDGHGGHRRRRAPRRRGRRPRPRGGDRRGRGGVAGWLTLPVVLTLLAALGLWGTRLRRRRVADGPTA
ncbi:MAG: hypothetical protein U5R31_04355 [Acidimicrobiia bacterium]|nr:hypothetical protein [Acidimicrobiia bacterium]